MLGRFAESSPRFKARLAGVFYILMILAGGLGGFARRGLVVGGDAAATATNILAHEPLFRLGFAADILAVVCYIVVTVLLYDLFRPVNRNLSLLAAVFSLVGCTIQAVSGLFQLAPLIVLGNPPYLSVFKLDQLHALAYMSLKLYSQTYGIALIFFGFYELAIGCLILRSVFLPRVLGVLLVIAGLAGLTFLAPAFGAKYLPYILICDVGEMALVLWLLVKGVDAERWHEQASAAGIGRA